MRELVLCYSSYSYSICFLQRHDIVKKRLDQLGNVLESKQDGIGAPKVGYFSLKLYLYSPVYSTWTKVHLLGHKIFICTLALALHKCCILWYEATFAFSEKNFLFYLSVGILYSSCSTKSLFSVYSSWCLKYIAIFILCSTKCSGFMLSLAYCKISILSNPNAWLVKIYWLYNSLLQTVVQRSIAEGCKEVMCWLVDENFCPFIC